MVIVGVIFLIVMMLGVINHTLRRRQRLARRARRRERHHREAATWAASQWLWRSRRARRLTYRAPSLPQGAVTD